MTNIIADRLRKEAAEATDWHGETMKQWDKIRSLCAERDGSDLPRLMFEGLIESLADAMLGAASEIDRLAKLASLQGQEISITRERDEALEDAARALIDEISTRGTHERWKRLANLIEESNAPVKGSLNHG
jgi:hypothetical protein